MNSSPEQQLIDLVREFYDAVSRGDADAVEAAISQGADVLLIGTDASEWWTSAAAVKPTVRAQADAGIKVQPGDIQASVEGTVGWVADRGAFVLPDGNKVSFRFTAVFHQESDGWKLVQGHVSIGVPNRDALETDLVV